MNCDLTINHSTYREKFLINGVDDVDNERFASKKQKLEEGPTGRDDHTIPAENRLVARLVRGFSSLLRTVGRDVLYLGKMRLTIPSNEDTDTVIAQKGGSQQYLPKV
ncbi:hypothetical protein ACLOJK_009065 [Asimina triloba]